MTWNTHVWQSYCGHAALLKTGNVWFAAGGHSDNESQQWEARVEVRGLEGGRDGRKGRREEKREGGREGGGMVTSKYQYSVANYGTMPLTV